MARVTILFDPSEAYASVEAEEFHEDGEFIKAYSEHNELVAMFDKKIVKGAYIAEQKGQ